MKAKTHDAYERPSLKASQDKDTMMLNVRLYTSKREFEVMRQLAELGNDSLESFWTNSMIRAFEDYIRKALADYDRRGRQLSVKLQREHEFNVVDPFKKD